MKQKQSEYRKLATFFLIVTLTLFGCAQPENSAAPDPTAERSGQESPGDQQRLLTSDQQEIIDTFGRPQQFILAYLPIGGEDGEGLSRTEIWYYPQHRKKIRFVAGDILSVSALNDPGKDVRYSEARIENFDFSMNYQATIAALGDDKVAPIEFANNIFEQGEVRSYLGDTVTFTIEQGHLTYMQTLGVKD